MYLSLQTQNATYKTNIRRFWKVERRKQTSCEHWNPSNHMVLSSLTFLSASYFPDVELKGQQPRNSTGTEARSLHPKSTKRAAWRDRKLSDNKSFTLFKQHRKNKGLTATPSSKCWLWRRVFHLWLADISHPNLPTGMVSEKAQQVARSHSAVSVETMWRVWTSNSTGNNLDFYPIWQRGHHSFPLGEQG